jgi:hypothetical protein
MNPFISFAARAASLAVLAAGALLTVAVYPAQADFGQAPAAYFPNLPSDASSPEGFLRPGLRIEKIARGDIDADTLPDLAMIVRMDDPKNVLRDPQDPERDALDTNPRMIAVATALAGGGYRLEAVNMSLIPRVEDPFMNDPLVDLTIDKGSVRLMLEDSSSAGSWGMANLTFTFRKRGRELVLVGFDRTDLNRASGEMSETSVNFLSGRRSDSRGDMSSDAKSTKWSVLPKRPLTSLGFMGDAFSFDPANP